MNRISVVIFLVFCGLGVSAQSSWSVILPTVGTFSSPRVSDLTGDGIADIILGAGRLEFQACDTAFFALDGTSGKMLWNVAGSDQIFGSAALLDIDRDGVQDIFLNGRSSELKAISGKSGEVIWKFDTLQYLPNQVKRWFNFYNPQFIHDVDEDGVPDLLLANGGDIWVKPHDQGRAAGRLVILSGATGKLLAGAQMPDSREIYMSAVVDFDPPNPPDSRILFGTGGETVDGSLYLGTLKNILEGDLSGAIKLEIGQGKGFIAPPVFADINEDGIRDMIATSVNGRIIAFDGTTHRLLWRAKLPNTEAYSSLAVGMFNADHIPDFFVSFAQGIWPDLSWTRQAMINGKNGRIEYLDSLGYYQTSSPVVADLTGDGIDEVVLSVDYQKEDSLLRKTFFTSLYAIEFTEKQVEGLVEGLPGHNVSSTPWIGDIDGDGLLDIIYCHGTNTYHTYTFDGLRVNCLKTTIPLKTPVKWGAYMGSNYDGVFR